MPSEERKKAKYVFIRSLKDSAVCFYRVVFFDFPLTMGFSTLSITKAWYFFDSTQHVRGSNMNARQYLNAFVQDASLFSILSAYLWTLIF